MNKGLKGKVVLITGGSRGLGLALAREYASSGARLILFARNHAELNRARMRFLPASADVSLYSCDIADPVRVRSAIQDVAASFGHVDVLVNNAGVIQVGPLDAFGIDAFEKTIQTNLMGMIRVTLETLPHMPRGSRIVNVTSIGAAVSVPHLLPYSVSKFGALGFSLGLDAELVRRRITVTSVLPGLMRTGSYVQADFRGDARREFNWFSLGATMPGVSIPAERAARRIVKGSQERRHFLVLGPQARLLRRFYQGFPELFLGFMRILVRFLPGTPQVLRGELPGKSLGKGDAAGDRLNENAA
jgi:NAD(P)-dependent dehydrogenase (short-subunit alcohol dehydrogenase family)